jgi:hypothetical protein
MAINTDYKQGYLKWKAGDFQRCDITKDPSGLVVIKLSSDHYEDVYKFTLRHEGDENEEVLDGNTGKFIPTRDLPSALP